MFKVESNCNVESLKLLIIKWKLWKDIEEFNWKRRRIKYFIVKISLNVWRKWENKEWKLNFEIIKKYWNKNFIRCLKILRKNSNIRIWKLKIKIIELKFLKIEFLNEILTFRNLKDINELKNLNLKLIIRLKYVYQTIIRLITKRKRKQWKSYKLI